MRINVTKMARKAHKEKMRPFWEQMDRYDSSVEALRWMISCDFIGKNEVTYIREQVEQEKNNILASMRRIEDALVVKEDEKMLEERIRTEEERSMQSRRGYVWGDLRAFIIFVAVALVLALIAHYIGWAYAVTYMLYAFAVISASLSIYFAGCVVNDVKGLSQPSHEEASKLVNARFERLQSAYDEEQESLEECYELLDLMRDYLEN